MFSRLFKTAYNIMKQLLKRILNNHIFENSIMTLIILNLMIFVLDSITSFHNAFYKYIGIFEFVSVLIFTMEYVARIIVIDRFSDIFRPMMLIDFFAVVPYYFSFWTVNTLFLRIFRLSRLFRLFKIGRYSQAMDNIINGFKEKKEELILTLSLFALGILLSSILIFIFEHDAQPQIFTSIPKCFYFSVITLTSVGYGDIHPLTTAGRVVCGITAVFGIGLHGLFIGVMGAAFMRAFGKNN